MANATAPTPPLESAVTPNCIQPGGGFCMSLELAWGRFRRGYLRLLRPTYVRRMAEKRQGQCTECPHDIIDSRDLKYYRNVCGHWFRPEDDPFRWRDRLRLARAGLAELLWFSSLVAAAYACTIAAWMVVPTRYAAWLYLPGVALLIVWVWLVSFFRDPERIIPDGPELLISPADGTVTHVDEVDDPDFPGGKAFRISIFLSIFNVHVNRAPRSAEVLSVRYFPGAFLDARDPESSVRNEQLWLDLQESGRLLRVKQISGAIARRIVCWLKPGDVIRSGDRYGMIKFGSRTEILVPIEAPTEVRVKVGDKVKGGSTVLMRVRG